MAKAKTKKVAKKKVTASKTASKSKETAKILKEGFDPKNRQVILESTDKKKFVVKKPAIAFESEAISSIDDANDLYNQKLSCSQN